jgi:hypothetical protein
MSLRSGLAAVALTLVGACPLVAQRPESGAFLVRLGNDTVGIESFTRTASRLDVDQVWRAPRTTLRRYVVDLGADGSVTRAEIAVFRPGGSSDRPMQRVVATFHGDSATWETRRGDSVTTRTVAAPAGTLPLLFPAYSTLSLLTEKARRAGQDSVSVTVQPGTGQAFPVAVKVVGSDSMTIQLPTGQVRARVDRPGHFLGSIAPEATAHHIVTPVAGVDVRAMAVAFAARDSAGQGMGVLSPRDTLRAVIAGVSLMVDYGRPMKRGRQIFGGIVPWDKVWRTGANAATQFSTDRDLVIGGVAVPAGKYTLWTVPGQGGWKLVVNRQTGQWGTEYHEAQDLVRIDMQVEELTSPAEQFTIAIAPEGSGGVLRLAWDRTQASVRFVSR